jgi:hypothetical protein
MFDHHFDTWLTQLPRAVTYQLVALCMALILQDALTLVRLRLTALMFHSLDLLAISRGH